MALKPAAFLSYVHLDDQHDGGRLTEFRKRLSAEVRTQRGEEFPIFQDKDLEWGENWKKRIEKSLDTTTFFIPIITPSFFNSEPCLDELERFLERERELAQESLVLPVYYVECPLLTTKEPGSTRRDKLAQVIASRQYFDWRDLRFEPITSALVSKTIAQLATYIRKALELQSTPSSSAATQVKEQKPGVARDIAASHTSGAAASGTPSMGEPRPASEEPPTKISSKTEPPTRIVDPMHRGDYTTIREAIQAAKPGDRILVRRGLYEEGIVMDKPLEIIGNGSPGDVVIRATGRDALLFKASMGRIANLSLRQAGGGNWYGIDVAQGRLEVEDCDITSESLACIAIHNSADPRVRRNRIHDGKGSGIIVYGNGQGTLEDNDIFGNSLTGVEVNTGGNPTLRRNLIRSGNGGVLVHRDGKGTFEDNDVFGHANSGVFVNSGGNPVLRRNRIHECDGDGVYVYDNGQGTFEDNEIFGNSHAGVEIGAGGSPTLRRNRITKNEYEGVWVHRGGAGTFESNDLRGNSRGAWDTTQASLKKLIRKDNLEE